MRRSLLNAVGRSHSSRRMIHDLRVLSAKAVEDREIRCLVVKSVLLSPDTKNATLYGTESCIFQGLVAAEGLEPPTRGL